MSRPPVKVNQTFYALSTAGVDQQYFAVKNIGFSSDRGIGVCDQAPVSLEVLFDSSGRNQAFRLY